MYKKQNIEEGSIQQNDSVEGEPIELKIERIVNNNEPITDGAPTVYTERSEGVMAEYNIRSDRFDIALDATDSITKSHLTKRKEALEARKAKENPAPAEPGESPKVSQ